MKISFAINLMWFFLFTISVNAQVLPAGSDPGQVEKRFEQTSQPQSLPKLRHGLESTTAPEFASQTKIVLRSITLKHSSIYTGEDIKQFYQPYIGKTVSLTQVFSIAAQITAKYGEDGYLLSRVIVPPQELEPSGANITLQAVEGYISEVVWPDEVSQYRDFFSDYSKNIKAQRPINSKILERYLLLANDLPGLTFQSTIKSSKTVPTSSVLHLTLEKDKHHTSISIDNHGTEASGPYQATIQTTANNLASIHDRLMIGYVGAGPAEDSNDSELHYTFFEYSQVLNSEGLKFKLLGNASWGDPGTEALQAVNFETEGQNISAELTFPFIRSRSENLTGSIAFDYKDSQSVNLSNLASEDRLRIFRGELAYDFADEQGGINQLISTVSTGIEGLGSTKNSNINASRAQGRVDFFKTTLEASRRQKLPQQFSLLTRLYGQWTNMPLLSSQECGYGGQRFGRGFNASTIVGDRCFQASIELQKDLRPPPNLNSLQLYGFADFGHIENIDAPLGTPENDNASSAGVGMRFGKDKWSADLTLTKAIDQPDSIINLDEHKVLFRLQVEF